MSTRTFLVFRTEKQCVEVAASGGFGVRASQQPRALALFCYAYRGEQVEMLSDGDLERFGLDYGELTEWTDEKAGLLYNTNTGTNAPESD